MKLDKLVIALAAFSSVILAALAQAAPPNDNFSDRIPLEGSSITAAGTLNGATLEPSEPNWSYAPVAAASVWWSWTAPASGPVIFEVSQLSTNLLQLGGFELFTGTDLASGLTFIDGNTLYSGQRPFRVVQAIANTTYHLRVTGTNVGQFTIRILQTNAPVMMIQPRSRTVSTGESVFFGALAAGKTSSSPPLSYQWRFNGTNLPGETARILLLDNVSAVQAGTYSVVISNTLTNLVSQEATLTVTDPVPQPALVPLSCSTRRFAFRINGEPGRFYVVESSTNLLDWSEEKSFPSDFIYLDSAANRQRSGVVICDGALLSVPQQGEQKVYRARPYHSAAAVCVNHLEAIRFAKDLWSLENVAFALAVPTLQEIEAYFKDSAAAVSCPLGGSFGSFESSYLINGITDNPICMIYLGHVVDAAEDYELLK